MGWNKGDGLGLNRQGSVNPISVKQKDDNKGIGFQGHDDTWIEHQDAFSDALAQLNEAHGEKVTKTEDSSKKSLEEVSKKLKKRVHYHKFTRGKDLSRYSANDLNCILGSEVVKRKREKKEDEDPDSNGSSEPEAEAKEEVHEETGLVTINSGSLQDYFAKKMKSLKTKPEIQDESSCHEVQENDTNQEIEKAAADQVDHRDPDQREKKKKKNRKKKENLEEPVQKKSKVNEDPDEIEVADVKLSKKRKKKNKEDKDVLNKAETDTKMSCKILKGIEKCETPGDNEVVKENDEEHVTTSKASKKKKKGKKDSKDLNEPETVANDDKGPLDSPKRDKSKKKKRKSPNDSDEIEQTSQIKESKKKKKKAIHQGSGVEQTKGPEESGTKERTTTGQQPSKLDKGIGFKGADVMSIPGYGC